MRIMSTDNESSAPSDESSDSGDLGLKMLNARKMIELRRKIAASQTKTLEQEKNTVAREKSKPSDREIVLASLTDRGDEVFQSAESRYPREMSSLIPAIARLIREKKIDKITGGELLQFFRSLGMRISVQTSISVEDHGKFVSLADKLKRDKDL